MRICLLAWGSRGDVEPMIALGRGLHAAGHEVAVAAARDFTDAVTAAGLAADPFDVDMASETRSDLGRRWLEGSSRGLRHEARAIGPVVERFAPILAAGLVETAARYDVFVSGVITFGAMLPIVRARGVSHVLASLTPSAPTRAGSSSLYPVRPATDSVLNLAAGWTAAAGSYRVFEPVAREVARRLGLPRQTFRQYVRGAVGTPVLLGVSPLVVPPPADVVPRVVTTGYWTDPVDAAYAPPADLEAFLAGGPPPLYLGFGSMPATQPAALFSTMHAALRRIGRRGVVHGNWGGWRPATLPDDVLVVGDVPHAWLFPRAAGVVHHGGAGTTGAAVRAGVPQFVVPHMGDQPYWGRRVADLGIGPRPVPRHALDVDRLAAALTVLTGDPSTAARAARLGAAVRAEDGVGRAVEALNRLLGHARG